MGKLAKWIQERSSAFVAQVPIDPVVRSLAIEGHIRTELDRVRATMPDNLILKGFKVFSQVDEDGIIEAISNLVPAPARNKTFIEIGCGRGVQNNTAYLVLKDYRGVWVDGSSTNIQYIRDHCPGIDKSNTLKVDQRFIHRSNVASLLGHYVSFIGTSEPEFFTLDIDGNDAYILEIALQVIQPAIVCLEYNGKFPAHLNVSITYNEKHTWNRDDYFGASLAALVQRMAGYTLVACNVSGVNAFFVRDDLKENFVIYPVEQLYRKSHHELAKRSTWNPSSLNWIRDKLECGYKQSA